MNLNKLATANQSFRQNPSNRLARIMTATIVGLLLLLTGKASAAWQCGVSSLTTGDASRGGWQNVPTQLEGVSIRVHVPTGGRQPNRGYVICHGMDGTVAEDRFERLAQKLAQHHPDALVAQVDWSTLSKAQYLGLSNPWLVARRIPSVADACHEFFALWELTPEQWVFVGESFGNNVNARLSESLGNQSTLIAFNPASDLGGGGCLDLRKCSLRSFAFQTDSTYDTLRSVAHRDVFLVASDGSNDLEKHTCGIQWLVDQLETTSMDLFERLEQLPLTDAQFFTATVDASGRLEQVLRPRSTPEQSDGTEPANPLVTQSLASNNSPTPIDLAQAQVSH